MDTTILENSVREFEQKSKFVCHKCLIDDSLKNFIKRNSLKMACSYCESKAYSIDFFTFINFLQDAISYFYSDALDAMGVFEGQFPGETYDTYDLLQNEIGDITENKALFYDIIEALPDYNWCKKDPQYLKLDEGLKFSWEGFCNLVKYKMRYVFLSFLQKENEIDHILNNIIPSNELLFELSKIFSRLKLVKILPRNLIFYRARPYDGNKFYKSAEDLGPPSSEKASNNRMSPLGIPMFYGATNKETAFKEIQSKAGTIAEFKLLQDIQIIDFTVLPLLPSIFNQKKRNLIEVISFLYHFSSEVSKPIEGNIKSKEIHLEYIPTQILTEYIRYLYPYKILGIKYASSFKTGQCYVFFIDRQEVCDIGQKTEYKMVQLVSCINYSV